jgi:hypothetical protein
MGGPPSHPRRSSLAAAPRHCLQTDVIFRAWSGWHPRVFSLTLCITLKGMVMNKQPREPAKGPGSESPNLLDSTRGPGGWGTTSHTGAWH